MKFAEISLDRSTCYKEIVPYANSLNEKANQLLIRASLNKNIDCQKLQSELFETGRGYIRKFALTFNLNKITGVDEKLQVKDS